MGRISGVWFKRGLLDRLIHIGDKDTIDYMDLIPFCVPGTKPISAKPILGRRKSKVAQYSDIYTIGKAVLVITKQGSVSGICKIAQFH